MKKHFSFTNPKSMAASMVSIGITGLLLGLSFVPRGAHGEFDFQGLSNQVQQQQEQLNNHEARISNTEKDVKNLQDNTSTAPAADRAPVPAVSSNTSAVAPVAPSAPPVAASPKPGPYQATVENQGYVRYTTLQDGCDGHTVGYHYYNSGGQYTRWSHLLSGSDSIPNDTAVDNATCTIHN